MSFFDNLKNLANKATNELTDQFNKIKNKDVMEAVVAACTYISYADGQVSSAEKNKMMGFLQNTECLKMFKTEEVVSTFTKYAAKFDFDLEIGKSEVLRAVGKIKKPEEARLVARACVIIANSDGNFDLKEKNVFNVVCRELGLDAEEFLR